ncbi:MAG: bifunctional 4-hydroxy-2-oxoglutarate aldolase/2-dehydro-3-deoxy-phosphogluconate aldolase, partial [Bacteroidetes bacterium]
MFTFSRLHIAQTMATTGLVPIFFNPDPEVCKQVAKACYAGGIRILEFTNRGEGAYDAFRALHAYVRAELPDMAIGVGSIVDGPTTAIYLQAGADFIVSPIMNPEMAKICNRRKVLWSPGCGTLSEVSQAEELGAEIVKLFPGGNLGPGFIKAIKGPCPWSSLMPTGG